MSDPIGPVGPYGEEDLAGLLRLSRAEDWPHTDADWRAILAAGQVFGHRNAEGAPLTSAAMVPYDSTDGHTAISLGMIIVERMARRRGLGQELMGEILRRAAGLTPPPLLRLISTRDGQPLYEKFGFRTVEMLHSYRRPAGGASAAAQPLTGGQTLRPLETALLDSVIALDTAAFGQTRRLMLEQRAARAERGLVLFEGTQAVGYGLLVRQASLANLGPVVAPNDAGALALITALMSGLEESPFRIDLPARQKTIFAALEALGFGENDVPPIMIRRPEGPDGTLPDDALPSGSSFGGASPGGSDPLDPVTGAQKHYYGIAAQALG